MEQIEDLIVNINIQNRPNAMNHVMQGMIDTIQRANPGKSPAEITEMTNQYQNFMTNILNRVNIPLETKLIDEREFLFYKLVNEKNICPKLRSWKRKEGKFLIEYKKHDVIDNLTEEKKGLAIHLINQLHHVGIFHGNLTKDNIVYNQYEGIKLTGFSEAMWIDTMDDEQFLLNNQYGPCSTIEELLQLELKMIDKIFERDSINLDGKSELKIDDHFHSSDEENVFY